MHVPDAEKSQPSSLRIVEKRLQMFRVQLVFAVSAIRRTARRYEFCNGVIVGADENPAGLYREPAGFLSHPVKHRCVDA